MLYYALFIDKNQFLNFYIENIELLTKNKIVLKGNRPKPSNNNLNLKMLMFYLKVFKMNLTVKLNFVYVQVYTICNN